MFVKDGAITQTRWERVPDLEKVTCNGSPQGPASCTVRCSVALGGGAEPAAPLPDLAELASSEQNGDAVLLDVVG